MRSVLILLQKVLHRKTFMDRVKELAEAEDYNIHIWDEGLRVEL